MRRLDGRCNSCGYLSIYQDSQYYEVDAVRRTKGNMFTHYAKPAAPICFRHIYPIADEIKVLQDTTDSTLPDAARDYFLLPKNCSGWYPYKPGLSPAEHLQAQRTLDLENDRRAWEAERQREAEEFQLRLDERNKEFLKGLEAERREYQRREGKLESRLVIAALILAAAEVLGNVPQIQRLLGLD